MRINTLLFPILFTGLLFFGCRPPRVVLAPKGTVPKRSMLAQDVFGGYITVTTRDSVKFSGELIGMRNDSLVILSQFIIKIQRKTVSAARIIVHMPNDYSGAGIALMGASGAVMVHAGTYGGGPLSLGLSGILFNGIGLASAQNTENLKINYFDWSEGWEKVMVYSRFPYGIPSTINLLELKGRNE